MSPAERQTRHRAKLRQHRDIPGSSSTPAWPRARVRDRSEGRALSRPRRWAAAMTTLVGLREEYRAWLDNLPANLQGSLLADKLQAMAELDLEELQGIDPPRGYGRDR
jgi:hypothetical protein